MNNMRIANTVRSTVSTFHRGEKRRMDHPQKEACSQLFYTTEDTEEKLLAADLRRSTQMLGLIWLCEFAQITRIETNDKGRTK